MHAALSGLVCAEEAYTGVFQDECVTRSGLPERSVKVDRLED
jgi:hypothetical protein